MNILDTPTVSGGVTFTTGSTDFLAPDGSSGSINKYVGGTSSGTTQLTRYSATAINLVNAGTYNFSLFVKAGATNPLNFCAIAIASFSGVSGTTTSYFSLASGTALTSGSSIQDYGNGWYRIVSAPFTVASGDLVGSARFYLNEISGSVSVSPSGVLGLTAYTWGAQVETGSVATSYIPTTTTSATRNADVISISGAVSGLIGQSEGTIYAEVDYRAFTSTTARRIVSLRVDATTLISLEASVATGSIYVNIVSGGSSVTANATGLTSGIYKIAVAYNNETNGTVIYVNGTLMDTKTAIVPDVRTATIGLGVRSDLGSTNQFNDRIRAAALYTTRLDDADLMVLTSPTYYSNVRDMIWDTFVARTSTFSELPGCLQTRHNELITL
jgi:hypothetical protein